MAALVVSAGCSIGLTLVGKTMSPPDVVGSGKRPASWALEVPCILGGHHPHINSQRRGRRWQLHAPKLLDALRDSLARRDIPVTARLATHSLTAPDRWTHLDTGESGPTISYTDSHATAAAVLAGDVIAQSREQIVAEFALADAAP